MLKTIVKSTVVLGAVLASAFSPLANVFAEDGILISPQQNTTEVRADDGPVNSWLQVAPVSNRVKLIPGSTLEYSLIVSNIGNQNFDFSVYSAPYSIVDEDYNLSFSNENQRTQLSRWIQFINTDGSLTDKFKGTVAAGEQMAVNYRITVPDDVPSGGQYAVILTQTENDNEAESVGVQTVSRVGTVIYGRTDGDTNEKAELLSMDIPTFKTQGKINASSVVKNTGNTDFEAKYRFVVTSIIGKELYVSENSHLILPDTQRKAEFVWDDTPAIGIFQVHYQIETYGEMLKEKTVYVMIVPIYLIVIMILLLTFAVIWIIMLIRKRKERKSRLLV